MLPNVESGLGLITSMFLSKNVLMMLAIVLFIIQLIMIVIYNLSNVLNLRKLYYASLVLFVIKFIGICIFYGINGSYLNHLTGELTDITSPSAFPNLDMYGDDNYYDNYNFKKTSSFIKRPSANVDKIHLPTENHLKKYAIKPLNQGDGGGGMSYRQFDYVDDDFEDPIYEEINLNNDKNFPNEKKTPVTHTTATFRGPQRHFEGFITEDEQVEMEEKSIAK